MEKRIGIITGASSGIGRSIAIELAKTKNFNLILNGRNIDALKKLQQEVNEIACSDVSEIVVGDVKEKLTLENCIDKCKDKWGNCPTLFVASAGRGLPGTLLTSNELEWKQLIDTNILGLMNQLKAISKNMIESISNGHNYITSPYDIIIIGSSIGRNVSPFNSVYGSTKFATHGLSEALRRELGPKGIRVTLIEPGIVETNFQENAGYDLKWFQEYSDEIGPILKGSDVANVIQFLIKLPGNVHLDNISIRPTRQAYP